MKSSATVIEGSPSDIMRELSGEIVEVLQAAGIQPTGMQALAMCHALVAMVRAGIDCRDEPGVGQMPSFAMLLGVLSHGLSGSKWTDDERKQFDEEFCKIVESLGGHKLAPGEPRRSGTQPIIMSPKLGSC